MNTALIFAGGTGVRMKSNGTPKQFLEIFGKPTIVHTIEKFERCESIDDIIVVCLEDWIDFLKQLLVNYGITKVSAVIPGGKTGFESRYIGIDFLMRKSQNADNDIVLIHDGVRPMINAELICECISCAAKYGNAITVSKANETVIYRSEKEDKTYPLERSNCLFARAPQTFILQNIYEYYRRAFEENKRDMIDSATIAEYYGEKLKFVEGPIENIKVTTPVDYYLLRGMLEAGEYSKFFGNDGGADCK